MEDTLAGHSAAYSRTLEAGRHLQESVKDLELQNQLQTELQDLEEAWNKTQSRLARGRDLVEARAQVRYQLNALNERINPIKNSSNSFEHLSDGSKYACFSNETPSRRENWNSQEKMNNHTR